MDDGVIGVFDSGVGGLSVWREIVRELPGERTVYVADQVHVPYGSRLTTQVLSFAEEITRFLLALGAKIIVIASNTISAASLYSLRNQFPDVPFVGMEPALKPATERTRTNAVGVIATPRDVSRTALCQSGQSVHQRCVGSVSGLSGTGGCG